MPAHRVAPLQKNSANAPADGTGDRGKRRIQTDGQEQSNAHADHSYPIGRRALPIGRAVESQNPSQGQPQKKQGRTRLSVRKSGEKSLHSKEVNRFCRDSKASFEGGGVLLSRDNVLLRCEYTFGQEVIVVFHSNPGGETDGGKRCSFPNDPSTRCRRSCACPRRHRLLDSV